MNRAIGTLTLKDQRTCVLYDSKSGDIFSVYHSLNYEGAAPGPDEREMESRARSISKRVIEASTQRRVDDKNIKALFIDPPSFDDSRRMKVDLKQLRIVPVES
jgi:hypothetical protein